MKQVIMIPSVEEVKPVEFTHVLLSGEGWKRVGNHYPNDKDNTKVVYLGKCGVDGDMFAVYTDKNKIIIYKGHLNSGKY